MDKSWMKLDDYTSDDYANGVRSFIRFALENSRDNNKMLCPCRNCLNLKSYPASLVKLHLLSNGIDVGYIKWLHHFEIAENLISPSTNNYNEGEDEECDEGDDTWVEYFSSDDEEPSQAYVDKVFVPNFMANAQAANDKISSQVASLHSLYLSMSSLLDSFKRDVNGLSMEHDA
ncbi:hypothetical protein ACJIZ3_021410 [Penstemon smallii]|uniref:Transposase-associated domain-containing protein n=1 Tax=Penstemon smallii TaxID=265156 RepID=A0ABD3SLA8_9LAMI